MYFRLLHDERSGAVSYLLADLDAGEAVLIDPRGADVPLLGAMLDEHQLRLRWLLRTHEHDALLTGEAAALDALGAPRIQHQTPMTESAGETRHAVLTFGNEHVQVLQTPGHTAGCLSYLWRDRLFCGDAFDLGSCADAGEDADPGLMFDTLSGRLFQLPGSTLLFPAHPLGGRRVALLGEQRLRNASLLTGSRDAFITEMLSRRTTAQRRARPSSATRRH